MNGQELQDYLHEHIPLSRAMGVEVVSVGEDSVVLQAPLAPNINHRETLFGGSASAIAILSAWSLVHTRLHAAGMAQPIVIRNNTMRYDLPVDDTVTARSYLPPKSDWQSFTGRLEERGMARIIVDADLERHGKRTAHLSGEFVAFSQDTLRRLSNFYPNSR